MANYANLKAAVEAVITTNGNNEITGAILQSSLLSIINSIGDDYLFAGVATPSTNPSSPDQNVFYIGGAGVYANFGTSITVPDGSICVFKYNGSWTKELCNVGSGAFNVSKANAVGGVYATYSTLSDALNAVPSSSRQGGMTIIYIDEDSQDYVQYRLMNKNWSTNVNDWQGVDDEPTAGSDNMVKSRGVYDSVSLFNKLDELPSNKGWVGGSNFDYMDGYTHKVIPVKANDVITATAMNNKNAAFYVVKSYVIPTDSIVPDFASGESRRVINPGATETFTIVSDAKYLVVGELYDNVSQLPVSLTINGYDIVKGVIDISASNSAKCEENSEKIQQVMYDVTANNDGATFASLSALLSSENLSMLIPIAVRCGGMSIRFVRTSDNKYVQYRLMATSFSITPSDWQGVDDEPTVGSHNLVESGGVEKEISYYTEGSQLTDNMKNWLRSNIDAILLYDSDYMEDRKYSVSYLMLNHSALGGSGYLGFQIEIKDSSNNVLSQDNYKILATNLKPYSTYLVPADSGDNILYIRTKKIYSWETNTLINGGDVLSLQAKALGKDVLPFIEPSLSQVKQDIADIKDFDDKLGKTFAVINAGGLTPAQIGLIADIYVVGDFDIPVGGYLGISYFCLNNANIGGTGCLGLQIGLYVNGQWSRQANCSVVASAFQPGKLYKFDSIEKGSTIGAQINAIYVRTSDTFVWPSYDVIQATQIKISEFGYGKNVFPFTADVREMVELIETKVNDSFVIVNDAGLTAAQLGLIKDIYVVGNFDIPVGNKLIVTYIGFNNSNLGGVGKLGLQFAFYDGNTVTQPANCIFNASIFQAGKLYKYEGMDSSGIGSLVDAVYIRTSDTFAWINDDILASYTPILEIKELGYGKNVQPFFLTESKKKVITVGKTSKFDYNSLTAATNVAPDGAIILVYPGIYDNECVTAGTSKTLYIIGIDRDKCVIKNNLGAYQYAVIHIASGLLRNLTVIQEGTNPGQTSGAYGVHADFPTAYQSTLRIENCHLQSNVPDTGGIGIGLNGGHLTLKDCRLVSGTSGRALYLHDADQLQFAGEQRFTAENCIIESPNQAIIIQGQGTPTKDFSVQQFYIEFCRNIIKGTISFVNWYQDHGTITPDDFQGVKNLRLVDTSWGNSANVLNANL